MPKITTPSLDIHSNSTTTEIFCPLTGPMNTTEVRYVNFAVWLGALNALKSRPGVQFSNDGIAWTDTPAGIFLNGSSTYATAEGWTYSTTGYTDIFAIGGTTPRLFCRFGLLSKNVSANGTLGAQGGLLLDIRPEGRPQTMTFGPVRVHCRPDAATTTMFDLSGPIAAAYVNAVRATYEIIATTNNMDIKIVCQQANNPDDATNWGDDLDLTSPNVGNSIYYGTTFTSVTPTKPWMRFGAKTVGHAGNSAIQAALVALRIDTRM